MILAGFPPDISMMALAPGRTGLGPTGAVVGGLPGNARETRGGVIWEGSRAVVFLQGGMKQSKMMKNSEPRMVRKGVVIKAWSDGS